LIARAAAAIGAFASDTRTHHPTLLRVRWGEFTL
jgi:hypothetical protein